MPNDSSLPAGKSQAESSIVRRQRALQRLKSLPLRSITFFFLTLAVAGFFRSALMVAVCIAAWVSFSLVKLGYAVKRKVDAAKSKAPAK